MAKKNETVKQTKKEVTKNNRSAVKARKGGFEELSAEELSTIIGGTGVHAPVMSW
jgi:bacteriocin-like protein